MEVIAGGWWWPEELRVDVGFSFIIIVDIFRQHVVLEHLSRT
jgi:hypothetical protein